VLFAKKLHLPTNKFTYLLLLILVSVNSTQRLLMLNRSDKNQPVLLERYVIYTSHAHATMSVSVYL